MANSKSEINTAERSSTVGSTGATAEYDPEVDGVAPLMPHTEYSEEQLRRLYPKLEAPEEDTLDDSHDRRTESSDVVLQHGLRVATEI